jgi:hypothetical protein
MFPMVWRLMTHAFKHLDLVQLDTRMPAERKILLTDIVPRPLALGGTSIHKWLFVVLFTVRLSKYSILKLPPTIVPVEKVTKERRIFEATVKIPKHQ